MKNLFKYLATAILGIALAVGVGVGVVNSKLVSLNEVVASEGDEHSIDSFTGKDAGVLLNNGTTPTDISISKQSYKVKQVIIGWTHNKSNAGVTASISIGDTSLGSGKVGGSNGTFTTTIGDGSKALDGGIKITWSSTLTGSGKGTLTLKSIKLVEASGASVVSISGLSADVSAKTGDSTWTIENIDVTGVLSDSPSTVDIKNYVNVSVEESVPTISSSGTMNVTLKAVSKASSSISKSVSTTAALTFINPYSIGRIYSLTSGSSITFDGIYMGDTRDGHIIMNGEYGMLAYFGVGLVPTHEYVAGVTPLTVSGTLNIYKNLYETSKTPTVEVLSDSDRISNIETPVQYVVTGEESATDLTVANRKTSLTGVPLTISDSSGNKTVTFAVNGNNITVFIAKSFIDVDETIMTKINDAKTEGKELTLEGFSSFYTDFQVAFTNLVEISSDYSAEDFAEEFNEYRETICSDYDGVTSNYDLWAAAWLSLNSSASYLKLSSTEKAKLVNAEAIEGGTAIQQCVSTYDYVVVKYGLVNFIERAIDASSSVDIFSMNNETNITTMIIVIVSLTSLTAIGGYFFIRKRKENH